MAGSAFRLTSIDLAVSSQYTDSNAGTTVFLTDTAIDGKPGTILESFFTGPLPYVSTPGIVTVSSVDHPQLHVGQEYFLILGTGGVPGGGWFYSNSVGDVGPTVNGIAFGTYNLFVSTKSAFRINGVADSAAVPEPKALWLQAFSIVLIALHRGLSRKRSILIDLVVGTKVSSDRT